MMPLPEEVVTSIRDLGSDATTLRDATHEASHALETNLDPPWSRDRVHEVVGKLSKSDQAKSEILARAVEQVVCRDLKVDPGTVEKWAFIACMEATASGISFPSTAWFTVAVRRAMEGQAARDMANKILRLVK